MGVYLMNAEMDLMRMYKHLRTASHNLILARRAANNSRVKTWRKEVARLQRHITSQTAKVERERVRRQERNANFILEVA